MSIFFGKDEKEGNNISFQRDKILSAIFYGVTSVLVIFTNKWLLTWFHFPHFNFVAAAQFMTTSLILLVLAGCKKIDIPVLSFQIFREIMPVSLMFLGNVLCGLGSTNSLNIPMFTALRRYSILMTMLLEWWFLNQHPATSVWISVGLMVGGAQVAALYDLAYDPTGYTLVFLNNIFTALNGVWMRKATVSGKCSKMGVLFYNSLFSGVIMVLYFIGEHAYYSGVGSSSNPSLRAYGANSIAPLAAVSSPTPGAGAAGPRRLLSTPSEAMGIMESSSFGTFLSAHSQSAGVERRLQRKNSAGNVDAPVLPNPSDRVGLQAIPQRDVAHSLTQSEIAETQARLSKLNNHINQEIHRYSMLQKDGGSNGDGPGTGSSGGGSSSPAIAVMDSKGGPEQVPGKPVKIKAIEGVSTITQVMNFPGWGDWKFVAMLLVCCCMGSVLNYAIFLCTTRNSALTTAVVGTLKNVITTYIGMMIFSDYAFTWINFIGINISIVGSIYYTVVAMKS